MKQTATPVETRNELMRQLNVLEHEVIDARARVGAAESKHQKVVNDAKAEVGTARAELKKVTDKYDKVRERLLAVIPEHPCEMVQPNRSSRPPAPTTDLDSSCGE